MTTINDVTSSQPLQPSSSPSAKSTAGAADVAASTSNNASATAGAASTAAAKTSSSVATISTIATQLQAAQAASSGDEVFSTSKVNEIKQAISEGRFQVNSARVADGLLEIAQQLVRQR
ncbi:negative regulator of flagellin synthesis FlgM [Oxalobacteraceae bacterium GrIS 2.11]